MKQLLEPHGEIKGLSLRKAAARIGNVSHSTVRIIAHDDLKLTEFKRRSVQFFTERDKQVRATKSASLLQPISLRKLAKVMFTDEKCFMVSAV